MSEPLPGVAGSGANPAGVHTELLKTRIPGWYSAGLPYRQQELSQHTLQPPAWHLNASHATKASLKARHGQYRETLNLVDNVLSTILNIRKFAEPLLIKALEDEFQRTLNVNQVYFVRKYGHTSRDDLWGALILDKQAGSDSRYQYRGTSLLKAALANFELDEENRLNCDDCNLITTQRPISSGDVLPSARLFRAAALPIAPEAFARLCRKLDLGARYQQHINAIIRPTDDEARRRVDRQLREHHKQSLAFSAEIALAKKDISADVYRMLQQVVAGQDAITLDGRAVTFASLTVFDIELVGPMLIGPDRESSHRLERVVAYIPGDPEQPLKQYATGAEFMSELRRRLHRIDYRRFFSRFVSQRHQGVFFEKFDRLYEPGSGSSALSDYPLKSNLRALPMGTVPISGDLWEALSRTQIDKILGDARAVAVPTGDQDRNARLARLDSYVHAVVDVLNLSAFVVPGLGPLLLMVGATQMFDEAFEGIEAFERDDIKEMWGHFSSVALNVAFVGAGATVLPHIQFSSVVNQLEPIRLDNGESRLWRPDLTPYQIEPALPPGAVVDVQGLYRLNGKQVLSLEDKYYEVQLDAATGRYRIRHPSRPDAYQPKLTHNGSGAWSHELEAPRSWEGSTLMRRLGHIVEGFSDAELEQIRTASDTSEEVLRRMHAQGEPIPVRLADTIKRFDYCRQVEKFIGQMQNEEPRQYGQAEPMTLLHLLTLHGPWPKDLTLKVIDSAGEVRWQFAHSTAGEAPRNDVIIAEAEVRRPLLLKTLIEAVDDAGGDLLANTRPWIAKTDIETRIQSLRQILGDVAVREKAQLINDHYASGESLTDPRVALIKSRYPSVPAAAIDQMMSHANPAEIQQMAGWNFADTTQTKPIALRIAEELRYYQRAIRLNRAYEGLYIEALATADTPRLILATLETLPGWSDTVGIELRENSVSGKLIDGIGPTAATNGKVIVKRAGLYQAFDKSGNDLSSESSLYDALQHALPDAERKAMGRPSIYQSGALQAAIGAAPLDRGALARRLKMQPVKPSFKSPMRLASGKLGYPLSGWREWVGRGPSREARVMELYPDYTREEVQTLLRSLGEDAITQLNRRKVELDTLRRDLDTWIAAVHWRDGVNGDRQLVPYELKHSVAARIERCWRRQSLTVIHGVQTGYELDLAEHYVGRLPQLSADFSHVVSLRLSDMGISLDNSDTFLTSFPSLRILDMSNNRLTGLPLGIEAMHGLSRLYLSSNLISLTQRGAEILGSRTQLKTLYLSDNPLGRLPDFSTLPGLEDLNLGGTGIDTWPTGLRDQPLNMVDLRANQLTDVPDEVISPPTVHAEAVARINGVTFIQGNPLTEAAQQRLRHYWVHTELLHPDWAALRLPGAFGHEPVGRPANLEHWLVDVPWQQLQQKTLLWQSLRGDPHSEEFFELLDRLAESQEESFSDLQARAWQMMEAASGSQELRRELFDLAGEPACEDRAALSFSYLEIKLMIHNAKVLTAGQEEAATLVKLAKGLFRLDEVERIALKDIQGRREAINADSDLTLAQKEEKISQIEEVEVRLAYRVGLKDRLDLPGQPKGGRFISMGKVSNEMLDAAARQVLALDGSAEQTQSLVGRDFWVEYLKQQHAASFQALADTFIERQIELDGQKAAGALEGPVYVRESESLGLQRTVREAELVMSLTLGELDALRSRIVN